MGIWKLTVQEERDGPACSLPARTFVSVNPLVFETSNRQKHPQMLYNVLWTTDAIDAIDAIDAMICAGLCRGMLEDWGHCAARQHLAAELAARDVHLYHASEEDPVRRVTL